MHVRPSPCRAPPKIGDGVPLDQHHTDELRLRRDGAAADARAYGLMDGAFGAKGIHAEGGSRVSGAVALLGAAGEIRDDPLP